jgi:heme/copper-type cytochrome/quinol oxidase subunit 4
MTNQTPNELFEKGFITEDQYKKIDLITSGKVVSVFYELRSLLYLGVMLFTAGMGILIYENIGDIGHIVSIIALTVLTIVCFWYTFKHALPYTNEQVKSPTPYFDYILLLGSLLFISVQGYLQFQYALLTYAMEYSTLITAAFFFFIAYRFDHLGILSLAITALASFWSISVSPQQWYSGNFFSDSELHIVGIIFSIVVTCIAMLLDKKSIKKHFTFTYLNFCLLIFFVANVVGMFDEGLYGIYLLLIYAGCVFTYYMARWKKSFLFLLYAFIAAYIGTTYLLADTIFDDLFELWFFYSIASCGGFIYFIIKYKNYFTRES